MMMMMRMMMRMMIMMMISMKKIKEEIMFIDMMNYMIIIMKMKRLIKTGI